MNIGLACEVEGGCGLCLSRICSVYISVGICFYIAERGMEKRKVGVDIRNYCEYLQGNYFVSTGLVLCVHVVSREIIGSLT
jgi:hypothetical protein